MLKTGFLSIAAAVCILVPILLASLGTAQEADDSSELRIMSFNIRYGKANDGENRWENRRANVITTIVEAQPDVFGVQETLEFQAAYLRENLTDYHYFGRSRENRAAGEQCGVMFKKSRFDLLESGHFWLSESPNRPGSKSWDSSLPRMASWVKLFDRQTRNVFYLLNTHFDHRGSVAREKSAELIVKRAANFEAEIPVIVTGDFNTAPDSRPHQVLTHTFVDTFGHLHPDAEESGTFGGYSGKKSGARIDFIFASKDWKVIQAEINHRNFDGRDPSDHFPVESTLRFPDRNDQ